MSDELANKLGRQPIVRDDGDGARDARATIASHWGPHDPRHRATGLDVLLRLAPVLLVFFAPLLVILGASERLARYKRPDDTTVFANDAVVLHVRVLTAADAAGKAASIARREAALFAHVQQGLGIALHGFLAPRLRRGAALSLGGTALRRARRGPLICGRFVWC